VKIYLTILTLVAVFLVGYVVAQQNEPPQTPPPPQSQPMPPETQPQQQTPAQPQPHSPAPGQTFPAPNTQPSGARQDHIMFNWNLPPSNRYICARIDTVSHTAEEIKCPSEVAQ
jgi:hypothetical protein